MAYHFLALSTSGLSHWFPDIVLTWFMEIDPIIGKRVLMAEMNRDPDDTFSASKSKGNFPVDIFDTLAINPRDFGVNLDTCTNRGHKRIEDMI